MGWFRGDAPSDVGGKLLASWVVLFVPAVLVALALDADWLVTLIVVFPIIVLVMLAISSNGSRR